MYSFYKPGIKKNSILVHEHDLVWIFWYVWYTEEFVILPVTMDLFEFFFTCFLHIVGIRVSRTSSLANHWGKLAFLIMVHTFVFIQTIAFICHVKKYFMFSSCDQIEWFLDHVMYIMIYSLYHVKLCIERERTAFVLLKWLNVVFLCVIFNCACLVRSV